MIRHLNAAKICQKTYSSDIRENPNKRTLIVKSNRELYIAIRGTCDVSDWKNNFKCMKTKDDIHKGFRDYALSCLHELIEDNAFNLMKKSKHITICAHSLGGTASIIIIAILLSNFDFMQKKNVDVVLFGSPKPGGSKFIKRFNELLSTNPNIKVYRYVNQYDYVDMYPPLNNYEHVCEEILLSPITHYKPFDIMNNHAMASYVHNLEFKLFNSDF